MLTNADTLNDAFSASSNTFCLTSWTSFGERESSRIPYSSRALNKLIHITWYWASLAPVTTSLDLDNPLISANTHRRRRRRQSPSLRPGSQARQPWTDGTLSIEQALWYILSPILGVYPLHLSVAATAGEQSLWIFVPMHGPHYSIPGGV